MKIGISLFKHTVCTFQGYLYKEHINADVYLLLKCAKSIPVKKWGHAKKFDLVKGRTHSRNQD